MSLSSLGPTNRAALQPQCVMLHFSPSNPSCPECQMSDREQVEAGRRQRLGNWWGLSIMEPLLEGKPGSPVGGGPSPNGTTLGPARTSAARRTMMILRTNGERNPLQVSGAVQFVSACIVRFAANCCVCRTVSLPTGKGFYDPQIACMIV
ncbi:hypothetical protein N658DRAFT_140248 [Parathielavia hyrcaniae]|uniref:Uncharacterized protein n=1 Tax=Parathielavia hyrcaniae TaxID=113614 RepID=A0AAN6PY67_9PEZI|nr:hypothetical protein N658DRAFT_140248 [Parathielavia hyrcaniae]